MPSHKYRPNRLLPVGITICAIYLHASTLYPIVNIASAATSTKNSAKNFTQSQKSIDEKIKLIEKEYILPAPLPTGRKLTKHSAESIRKNTKRQLAEKLFPKAYALNKTFDLPSLESLKPIQTTEKFVKITKIPDPLVKFNRYQFKSGRAFEKYLLRPIAKGWRKLPNIITSPIANFSYNLSRPTSFVNSLLQGNPLRAIQSLFAFVLDTTLGFGGTVNFANGIGIPKIKEDFGQTLAVYGVGSGAYLYLPIGSSSVRNISGNIIDTFAIERYVNPAQYIIPYYGAGINIAVGLVRGIDAYANVLTQIEAIEKGSLDLYTTAKRFYTYNRALQILNAEQNIYTQNRLPISQKQNQYEESAEEDPFADINDE